MYNTAATAEAGNEPVDQECKFSAAAMPKARANFSFWRSLSGANGESGVGRVRSGSVHWLHARRERREEEERKCAHWDLPPTDSTSPRGSECGELRSSPPFSDMFSRLLVAAGEGTGRVGKAGR